jgi:hypothetical protein
MQVLNSGTKTFDVIIESKLMNSNNEVLLSVNTNTIQIKSGINSIMSSSPTFSYVEYSSNNHAQFIKSSKNLPSGKYRYCASIRVINTPEDISDDYCDELESDNNNLLYLISVPDNEEIETSYPNLLWYHSEPFNLLASNEFYRIVITEIKKEQSADAALNVNSPIYMKNFLNSHSVQYPADATKLVEGKTYSWQVQKVSNGAIIDKTEAWAFTVKNNPKLEPVKYAIVKQNPETGYYQVVGNTIYFKYIEKYSGEKLICKIKNDFNKYIDIAPKNEKLNNSNKSSDTTLKIVGANYYELNLDEYKLTNGFYWLEVINERGEVYLLKFLIN